MNSNKNVLLLQQPESAAIKAFLASEREKLSPAVKERVNLFLSTLDFAAARFFQKDESEKIYYVPPKNNSSLDQALIIFCNEDGTYRRASRLRYSFGSNKKLPDFSAKDFYYLFSGDIKSKKGAYTFSTLEDVFLNRITINENRAFAYSSLKKNDDMQPENSTSTENSCTDWYLITTITNPDGTIEQTEQYLYTTCGDGCIINGLVQTECITNTGYVYPDNPEPVSKPKNWTVASGQVWRVYSDDILIGLRIANFPGGGQFTSVSHSGSDVTNYAGNEPGVPFSTWRQESTLQQVSNGGASASSYVKGKQTFALGGEMNHSGTEYWLFASEF
jgi:hypothetical protein